MIKYFVHLNITVSGIFFTTLFFFVMLIPHFCHAEDSLVNHLQLLVVTNHQWEDKIGTLQRFARSQEDEEWVPVGAPIPVVLGKSGMAWGIGLYPLNSTPSKIERDLKSPAGIFSLGSAFGFLPKSEVDVKIDYLQLNDFTEAVDDPLSVHYNCIVDQREVVYDWNSSEKMRKEPLYEMGLVINHNWPHPESGKGSAIFFHLWRNNNAGTAGCTAMSRDDLEEILLWLEKNKNPILIQLPFSVYSQLQATWSLPNLL